MKKLLTILLSLAMILSMGSVAFAEEAESPYDIDSTEEENNSVDINVYAKYKNGQIGEYIGDPTYKVVVSWTMNGSIEGTKTDKKVYKWNADTFKYDILDDANSETKFDYNENDEGDTLDQTKVEITVTNKSDADVSAKIEYVPETEGSKVYSMISDCGENGTESFNIEFEDLFMDSILGDTISGEQLASYEKAVLDIYTKSEFAIAHGVFEEEYFNDINGLIEWLQWNGQDQRYGDEAGLACPYYEEFSELLDEDSDATTLLGIFLDENDTLNPGNNDNHSIIDGSLRFKWSTGEKNVALTEEGIKYLLTRTPEQNVKIGCFTVTVNVPNIG